MGKKAFSFLSVIFIFSGAVYGQGEVPVNMYTGQPSISVPLYTVTSNDISVPLSLAYDINSATNKSAFGYGWNLSAGGSVSREVRSLPDDFGFDDERKGWFYNNSSGVSIALDIGDFTPSADTLTSTAEDETADNEKLYSFGYRVDTEPDIFHYSFGDVSGSFVFDNNLTIRTIPYRDIKIEPAYQSATDRKIISFTITTNDGYRYTFSDTGMASRRAVKNQYLNKVYFLSTDFELYNYNVNNSWVTYAQEWNLTRIDSPNGSYVTFTYSPGTGETTTRQVNIGYYKEKDPVMAGSTDLEVRDIYRVEQTLPRRNLTMITGSTGQRVDFQYNDGQLITIAARDARKGSTDATNLVRTFSFNYQKVDYLYNYQPSYFRSFLTSLTESSGCEYMPPMKFTYIGIGGPTQTAITRYDAWGFESGYSDDPHSMPQLYIYPSEPEKERYRLSPIPGYTGQEVILNGVNRNATGLSRIGALASIIYPHGAMTTFSFGPNEYLDTRTNENVTAGGLRINYIHYFDGYNSDPVTKTFEYTDPATGKSSGRLLRKPMLAMPAYKWKNPYNQNSTDPVQEKNYTDLSGDDVWKYLTMRTDSDITPSEKTEGNTVGYTFATVRRPGAGSATFEYLEPGTYGESTSGEWSATVNRFARPGIFPRPSIGIVSTGGPWRFPHAPNPSFDHERGLVWRKSEFSESGKLVRKTETSYQPVYRSGTEAVKVWGLRYDKYALSDDNNASRRIYFYGKYFLLTDTDKVPWVETTTTYDANDPSGARHTTESTEYLYESAGHRLVTRIKRTAADGMVYSTWLKYPKDYNNVTANAENAVLMLSEMAGNFRHSIPVETITTLKRGSGPERVTGARLIKFDPFDQARPLPESVWSLSTRSSIRIDSFKVSSVAWQGASYILDIDPHYEKKTSFLAYTGTGQPTVSKDLISRRFSATFYDAGTSLPVVQVNNATGQAVAFADFESATGLEFSSGAHYYGSGRSGTKAFYPGVALSKTVTRASVDSYILSFWIRSNASVNLIVNLKNVSGSTTYSSTIVSVASTGLEFRYVQKVIPVGSIPAGDFKIELQDPSLAVPPAGGSSPELLPVIDDVFFFPDNADMVSYAYQVPYGVSSVTSGTGEASHTVYDNLGRVKYEMDRDRNIIRKNTYEYSSAVNPLVAAFAVPSAIIVNENVTFMATENSCLQDVTYSWNFGGGFVTGTPAQAHTFSQTGSVTVTLKVSHPQFGEKTFSQSLVVQPVPLTVSICAKGVMEYNSTSTAVVSSYSCAEIGGTPPWAGVIFQVLGTTGCTGTCSYTWKMREEGAFSWTIVGTGPQYTHPKVLPNSKTFLMMCEVRSEEGGVASSTPMQVTVTP